MMAECRISFWVTFTLTLTSDLISWLCLEHISFITNNFLEMCLMPDQFFWGICNVTVTCLVTSCDF